MLLKAQELVLFWQYLTKNSGFFQEKRKKSMRTEKKGRINEKIGTFMCPLTAGS